MKGCWADNPIAEDWATQNLCFKNKSDKKYFPPSSLPRWRELVFIELTHYIITRYPISWWLFYRKSFKSG